jgi:hypothetical protein
MAKQQRISVDEYLRSGSGFHEAHFLTIRNLYQQLAETSDSDDVNESAITEVAHRLNLNVDTDRDRHHLRDCVRYSSTDDCKFLVSAKLQGEVQPMDDLVLNERTSSVTASISTTTMTNGMIRMLI